jgi:hypothetical protein
VAPRRECHHRFWSTRGPSKGVSSPSSPADEKVASSPPLESLVGAARPCPGRSELLVGPDQPRPGRRRCGPRQAGHRACPCCRRLGAPVRRPSCLHANVHRRSCSLVALVPGAFSPNCLGRRDGVDSHFQRQRPRRADAHPAAFAVFEACFILTVLPPWSQLLSPIGSR